MTREDNYASDWRAEGPWPSEIEKARAVRELDKIRRTLARSRHPTARPVTKPERIRATG